MRRERSRIQIQIQSRPKSKKLPPPWPQRKLKKMTRKKIERDNNWEQLAGQLLLDLSLVLAHAQDTRAHKRKRRQTYTTRRTDDDNKSTYGRASECPAESKRRTRARIRTSRIFRTGSRSNLQPDDLAAGRGCKRWKKRQNNNSNRLCFGSSSSEPLELASTKQAGRLIFCCSSSAAAPSASPELGRLVFTFRAGKMRANNWLWIRMALRRELERIVSASGF